jgi:hypothetical protein
VAKLSKKEQEILDQLHAKQEAPDEPQYGRSVHVNVDLGDEKQVSIARRIFPGLFDDDEVEDGSDEDEPDAAPKRRGYFDKDE